MATEEKIFNDRDNTNTLNHTTGGLSTVWTGVSHMVLDLIALDSTNSDIQFSTNVVGEDVVDFSTNGLLIFTLGNESVAAGKYQIQLVAVDGSNNKTQIIHPDRDLVTFKFSTTKTIT